MANLFPTNSIESVTIKENSTFELKGSYAIDFETMTFIKNPDGTVKILNGYDAYIQWCQLAIMTIRNRFKAYTYRFGREELNKELNKEATEMELVRITQEALMVHPNTESVDSFSFTWKNGEVYYEYKVTPIKGQSKVLKNTEKVW
ncbi:MAG: DUF2634 domain-containing protein [Clostridium perfringens]|nr:DUF2634 domain-containing protein [Clostridium butyricum]MDU5776232.1 DUF2634 domain-containing protein [Clostridium perfringens]